ncbi:MAG: ABC transporter substrate-binding protein [Gemmatimonadales bacterium]
MALRGPWLASFSLLLACGAPRVPVAAAIEIQDDNGTWVRLAAPAARVVSLAPATTELVFALGAGARLVGRTKWCDYPAEAAAVPSVGDGMSPNVEAIAAVTPDLVLVYRSPGNAEAVGKLRSLGIAVVELGFDRFVDFERAARTVAAALGRPAAGDSLAVASRAALERATVATNRPPSVLIVAWSDPPMTLGGGSFLNEIIERAGGRNLFADQARPSFVVSLEAVTARDPDRVLVVGEETPVFADRPEWQAIEAIRLRRFVRVSGSMFNRPGPRMADAVATLARALNAANP